MNESSKSLRQVMAYVMTALGLFLLSPTADAQTVTITDGQGVVYDITSMTNHTVTVSDKNASRFQTAVDEVNIVIPKMVRDESTTPLDGEFKVVGMTTGAFQGTEISSIDIQIPLTSIGNKEFYQCSKLKSVKFTNDVTSIGYNAFGECPVLESVGNTENVTTIKSYAFYNCASLKTYNFANGLQQVISF
jgi:hypothetical protein